jgi:nicotinamidase/pyrazinamidase
MGDYLKGRGVDRLYVVGLAADFCVYFTILDGLGLGFETVLIRDAARAISDAGFRAALKDIELKGGKVIWSDAVLKS